MSKIDWKKPLELTDGTPVSFLSLNYNEVSVSIPRSHKQGGQRYFSESTGQGVFRKELQIRNVADEFTIGQKVYFRDGREGIVFDTPTSFGSEYVRAVVTGSAIHAVNAPLVLAYTNGWQAVDKNWESENDFAAKPFAPKVTFTFRNVYADGTAGSTAHKALDVTKYASKVGKTRIGILKIGTDGSTELLKCVPSARKSGYSASDWADA